MWITQTRDTTKLTLELREITDQIDIWDFSYPSYYKDDEKKAFEKKVNDHYAFRQIGQETVGRWLHMFRTRMCEIMPYYIQLYKSQELMNSIEDPFGNIDITETFEQDSTTETATSNVINGEYDAASSSTSHLEDAAENSSSSNVTHENTSSTDTSDNLTRKFSNTPQGSISNLDNYLTEATIENGSHDTETSEDGSSNTVNSGSSTGTQDVTASATDTNTSKSTQSGTNETIGKVTHTYHKKGNQGVNTYAHDMKELRETFLNIDLMIINELNDLFLGIY